MKPFSAPLDDILFSINHVAQAGRLPDWDPDTASELLGHFASFVEGEIAPLNEVGDQVGAQLENGRVRMPPGFRAAYQSFREQGWPTLNAPEAYGGQELGAVISAASSEVMTGANHGMYMQISLVGGAIRTIMTHGSDDQKARFVPPLAMGEWLSTMDLTEPGAGSDLARIRTRAVQDGDGTWKITGEKIFISGGDHDLADGILHLVLARTSDDGLRGLSLFVCLADKGDGTRNAVTVTRIEEKMGIHASPTCQISYDGAEGELVGEIGGGLKAMFVMMNHARLEVSLQGPAHAARAWDIATSYAAERVQGRGPDGQAVTLDQHADVRRMLDHVDALAIGMRSISYTLMVALESGGSEALVDFLTPIAKAAGSEAGIDAARIAQQVLGGYGYLKEYAVEQVYRDARIAAIYEGTTGIHARGLATRGLGHPGADAFAEMVTGIADETGQPALGGAMADWQALRADMTNGLNAEAAANDFLEATIHILFWAMWCRVASVADKAPDPTRYGRVARYVMRTVPHDFTASVAKCRAWEA